MPSAKEMAEQLTEMIGIKVKSPYQVWEYVENSEQAGLAGEELTYFILEAENGLNPFFCEEGIHGLKETYNRLCDLFPELERDIRPRYQLEEH
jgi:hypothetical protein